MESSNGKGKGKGKVDAASADTNTNTSATGEENLSPKTLRQSQAPPPYIWTPAHQLAWLKMGKKLPPNWENFTISSFEGFATPPNVNIGALTIPLTASELLTFFPRHFNSLHFQDRLYRNGISPSVQASMINYQRELPDIDIVLKSDIQGFRNRARSEFPFENRLTDCKIYTVQHWQHPSANDEYDEILADYPFLDCHFGVKPTKFPTGQDAGPFTKAMEVAIKNDREDLMLSELDAFLAVEGISRDLEEGYNDKKFLYAYKQILEEYMFGIEERVVCNGYIWEW